MNLHEEITKWLSDYLENSGLSSFVIGISGGIDSALTSVLCADTGKKTFVVTIPINQKNYHVERSLKHIEWLKLKYDNVVHLEYNLTDTFDTFKKLFNCNDLLGLANSKSRLRMTTLYKVASENHGIVVGTGNKVEDFGIGFFTKYGDGGVDISPIADLTKTEVKKMATELGVIDEILNAKPTDGLWDDDRCDEDQIGATYEEIEKIMDFFNKDIIINSLSDREKKVLSIYLNLNNKNKHKMVSIPVFKKNEIHSTPSLSWR